MIRIGATGKNLRIIFSEAISGRCVERKAGSARQGRAGSERAAELTRAAETRKGERRRAQETTQRYARESGKVVR